MAGYGMGGFGGGNMQQLIKQAQKMQEEMQKKQQELEETIIKGSVSNGLVEVEMNGKKQVLSLKIKPEIVDSNDVEMLEDMIKAALNDASGKVDKLKEDKLGNMAPNGLF